MTTLPSSEGLEDKAARLNKARRLLGTSEGLNRKDLRRLRVRYAERRVPTLLSGKQFKQLSNFNMKGSYKLLYDTAYLNETVPDKGPDDRKVVRFYDISRRSLMAIALMRFGFKSRRRRCAE